MKNKLYENVKKLCEKKGISFRKLEQEVGFAPRYIYKWETNAPSIDKVKAVADYFGITIDELIGEGAKDYALEDAFNRPEMRMLFDTTKDCTAEDIYQAIKIIEALKK